MLPFNVGITRSSTAVSAVKSLAKTFIRGKKKATTTSLYTQRVVNQLSALSASRKQPKLLSLSNEDLIKHKTIVNAWSVYQRKLNNKREQQHKKQYASIKNAMEDLSQTDPELFRLANTKESGKMFPLEMRVPTDFPAKQPWSYNFSPKTE